MADVIPAEHVFDMRRLGEPLGTQPRGMLIMRTGRDAIRVKLGGSRARVIASRDQQHVIHVPLPHGPLAESGLKAVRHGRNLGVALHPGGDADLARLSLAFAAHLDDHRRHDTHPVRPCVTSVKVPELESTPDLVRLPHLLTVRDSEAGLSDTVVWEVMTIAQARLWLGGPLPHQPMFEPHLPALLHLRFLTRTGQLPASVDGQRLRELLAGRYMSIRLVYRHPALFAALIQAMGTPSVSGAEDD